MSATKLAAAVAVLSFLAAEARANFLPGLTVDRSDQFYNQYLNYPAFSPIGESFTPTLGGIGFAAIALQAFSANPADGATFDVELFEGVGASGKLLATTAAVQLPGGFGIPGPGAYAYFDFDREVALTPGTPYTLILDRISGANFSVLASATGEAGDQAVLLGSGQPGYNLTFGEGVDAAPEPSSLTLVGLGLVSVALAMSRKRARAA